MGGCESTCKNDMGSCQMRRCQGNHVEKHFHIIDDMNWWNSTSMIGAGRAGSPMTWVRREIHGSILNKNGTIFCLLPNSEKKAKDHSGHAEEAELAQSVVIETVDLLEHWEQATVL